MIAYRTAAKTVRESTVSVVQMARDGRVTELNGIGKTLEEKILALDETGDIPTAKKLRDKFPSGLISVMHLPGFGPKRARRLYDELGIDSLDALRAAAEEQKIRELRGFGAKVEEQLLKTLAESPEGGPAPRILLSRAENIAEQIVGALRSHPSAERVEVAGSLRRQADSVKDLDIIATAKDPAALAAALGELSLVESVLHAAGDAGARVMTHAGIKVDLKVVEPDQFGNVLQHFTGSKAHNVALREARCGAGLHVSEYGILDDATGETMRCATEEEVYETLGLGVDPAGAARGPRRARGGVAGRAGAAGADHGRGHARRPALPHDAVRRPPDARADGRRRRAAAGSSTSRSPTTRPRTGSATTSRRRRWRSGSRRSTRSTRRWTTSRCWRAPRSTSSPTARSTTTTSCSPSSTGSIASVHTSFSMSEKEMTDRMIRAIEHPWSTPSATRPGRKIETRPPYALDIERVIEAAARTGTMLEINSAPDRRDLNELHARAAAEAGVGVLVNTDAHSASNFDAAAVRDRDRAARVADARAGRRTRGRGRSSRRCGSARRARRTSTAAG